MNESGHLISVVATGGGLQVECSCGEVIGEMEGDSGPAVLPLSNVNDLAADHRREAVSEAS